MLTPEDEKRIREIVWDEYFKIEEKRQKVAERLFQKAMENQQKI